MQQDDKQGNEPMINPDGYTPLQATIIRFLKFSAWGLSFLAMMYIMHGPQA